MSDPQGSFFDRTYELLGRVGDGELSGVASFDQPYAEVQHRGGWENFMGRYGPKAIENHPGGGGPPPSEYLADALEEEAPVMLQRLADEALEGDLVRTMAEVQEDLIQSAADRAPEKTGALKRSSSVTVTDRGVPVYERPSPEPRRG